MYRQLLDMERRLDWTITRKRVEVQDALQRITPVSREHPSASLSDLSARNTTHQTIRTLRIFLSHTVSGQTWQQPVTASVGEGEAGKVEHDSGDGIPAWQLRIDGRLLEVRTCHPV